MYNVCSTFIHNASHLSKLQSTIRVFEIKHFLTLSNMFFESEVDENKWNAKMQHFMDQGKVKICVSANFNLILKI